MVLHLTTVKTLLHGKAFSSKPLKRAATTFFLCLSEAGGKRDVVRQQPSFMQHTKARAQVKDADPSPASSTRSTTTCQP